MNPPNECATCEKELGLVHCTGCDGHFCWNDLKVHRETLVNEMDEIDEASKRLKQEMDEGVQVNIKECPLIEDINAWEKNTIEKIKQVASETRDQLMEIMKTSRGQVKFDYEAFFKELARLQETQNYAEVELERLRRMLDLQKEKLAEATKMTTVKLYIKPYDTVDWSSLIYLKQVQTVSNEQPVTRTLCAALLPEKPVVGKFRGDFVRDGPQGTYSDMS